MPETGYNTHMFLQSARFLQVSVIVPVSSLLSLLSRVDQLMSLDSAMEWPMSQPCRFYAVGKCTRGDNCHFSHDISNSVLIAQAFSPPAKGRTPAPAPSTPVEIEASTINYCPRHEPVSYKLNSNLIRLGLI